MAIMADDDSGMPNTLGGNDKRLAHPRNKNRRFSGPTMCAWAALCWGLAGLAALSVIGDQRVAADFDSGTHTRDVAGAGWVAAICAVLGFLLLMAAVWRGPSTTRWISVLLLVFGGVPLLGMAYFAFLLSL
jgi:hypothetical protein